MDINVIIPVGRTFFTMKIPIMICTNRYNLEYERLFDAILINIFCL